MGGERLRSGEREKFLGDEWPKVYANIKRLGLNAEDLLNGDGSTEPSDAPPSKGVKPVPQPRRA